jgi:rhodanese-related sulfurtransferase
VELKARIDEGNPPLCIDVRTPAEYGEYRLGVGEKLIPLEEVRDRIAELPQDKKAEIVLYCRISLRAYEAARILKLNGTGTRRYWRADSSHGPMACSASQ